jgi:capsular exopolysaccharide synthesis family protein
VFLIATYASYARKDTRSPLLASVVQAVTCLGLVSVVLLVHGTAVLAVLGLAVSASVCAAACYLTARMRHLSRGRARRRLTPSLARFVAGAAVMAGPAWLCARVIPRWVGPPSGTWAGIVVAALVGAGVYVGVQAFWRTEELDWLTGGFTLLRGKAVRVVTAAAMRGASLLRGLRDRAGGGVRRIGYPHIGYPYPRIGYPRQSDGRRLSRPSSRWLLFPAIVVAAGAGAVMTLGPLKAMAGLLILLLLAAVCRWPPLAAYLVVVVTPLTVGISRGAVLPLIRPNEAVDLIVAAGLAARGIVRLRTGRIPRLRLDGVERAILLMAVFNSVLPLLWMRFRQQPVTQDDLLYALVMWKFLGLYVIVRLSVGTGRQIRRCLWLSVAAASVVAVVAILQSLNLLGVSGLVSTYYAYTGNGPVAAGARGSSTLGLPAATADLMIFNLAIVSGLWARYRRHRLVLGASAVLFVAGALATGEFSSALGLLIGVVCIAVVSGSPRLLALFIPAGLAGSAVLRSVIAGRLSGFRSPAGVPASWLDRISNLRTYFWPKLFSDWNFVLGVRPAARIPVVTQSAGFVWIESGYTWLLWAGGIPLLASYAYFVVAATRRGWLAARHGAGAASVAGAAAFVAVLVTTVLMIFDPHLTYRGSADVLFVLIALAAPLRAHRGALSNEAGYPHEAAMHGDGGSIVRPDDENTARDAPAPWPSSFSRFLRAHLASIVAIAVAVTAGAALLAGLQTREYKSQAAVVVYPATSQASNETQATVMGTEQAIALSGAVTAIASQRLHVPERTLHAGLSVSAAANSYLLVLSVKDPDPRAARRNAQAIADAYVAYRTAAQRAAPNGRPATPVAPLGAVNAAVITPASLPRAPSSPDIAVDVGAGLILGIVLGLGFALIRDRMDDRLRGPADLESQSTVPVLAVIPAVQGGGPDHADGLEMLRRPGSAVADAFRNLRTRVVQVAAWRDARTILVASAAGEEPALVSGNLAAALALAGRHVVLVCVDPRRARPQEMFNVTGRIGLTSVLDGNAGLAEAIQCTDVRGLEILPAGPVSGDPAAVPQAPELPGVLDAIRREADFVIIDAPPVLAGPDTSVLAELAEMMLLAADARRSTRTDVRTAARAMEQVHRVLEGCVLVNAGRGRRLPKLPAGPRPWLRRPLSRAWARVPIRHAGGTTPAPQHSDTT